MKKEITELLNSTDATLEINPYCTLRRWTKSFSQDVDRLEASFDLLPAYVVTTYEITARDWRGVVAEVQEAQAKAFADLAARLNSDLANGLGISKEVKHKGAEQ